MRKRANPAVIGGFVVGAVALIVIGVLLLRGRPVPDRTAHLCAVLRRLRGGAERGSPCDLNRGCGSAR